MDSECQTVHSFWLEDVMITAYATACVELFQMKLVTIENVMRLEIFHLHNTLKDFYLILEFLFE